MKAIITRNDQTAVLELPASRMELAGSLSQIGIRTPAHIIPCSDEEEDYIKVKLFGEMQNACSGVSFLPFFHYD